MSSVADRSLVILGKLRTFALNQGLRYHLLSSCDPLDPTIVVRIMPATRHRTIPFPLELRTVIYAHLLNDQAHATLSSIAATSKALYTEVIPLIYRQVKVSSKHRAHLLKNGLAKMPEKPRDMIKGRKKGEWFRYFDLERFNNTATLLNTSTERRKLLLLGMIETFEVADLGGLMELCEIICYYQRPPSAFSGYTPDGNRVFSSFQTLLLRSSCAEAISRQYRDRYERSTRASSTVIFENFTEGIAPVHLCVESVGWSDSSPSMYDCDEDMHHVRFALERFGLSWSLKTLTLHRMSGVEAVPTVWDRTTYLDTINMVFVDEDKMTLAYTAVASRSPQY